MKEIIKDDDVLEIANRPAQQRALNMAMLELKQQDNKANLANVSKSGKSKDLTKLGFVLDALMFSSALIMILLAGIIFG